MFVRAGNSPLLTARRWPHPVTAVLNPGATLVDGVTVLLCRVEDRRGSASVGVGPPPIETSEGWLVIYHGVRENVAGALCRVGLLLLDLDHPTVVRSRSC